MRRRLLLFSGARKCRSGRTGEFRRSWNRGTPGGRAERSNQEQTRIQGHKPKEFRTAGTQGHGSGPTLAGGLAFHFVPGHPLKSRQQEQDRVPIHLQGRNQAVNQTLVASFMQRPQPRCQPNVGCVAHTNAFQLALLRKPPCPLKSTCLPSSCCSPQWARLPGRKTEVTSSTIDSTHVASASMSGSTTEVSASMTDWIIAPIRQRQTATSAEPTPWMHEEIVLRIGSTGVAIASKTVWTVEETASIGVTIVDTESGFLKIQILWIPSEFVSAHDSFKADAVAARP